MLAPDLSWSLNISGFILPSQPVLAQVNIGSSFSVIMGAALIAAALALYFLRTVRPNLARDHDIFFSAVALVCGGIIFFQGWRLDPLLQLGQVLLAGSAIFFAVENIRLRGITVEQAKRSTPIVDDPDDRPVSRVYRAELDELPYANYRDDLSSGRRIRASRDYRDEYDYPDDRRRRPPTRTSRDRRLEPSDDRLDDPEYPPRSRSSRPPARLTGRAPSRSAWDDDYRDDEPIADEFDRSPDRPPLERPTDRSPERPVDRSPDRSPERPPLERPMDRQADRPVDIPSDRPAPRPAMDVAMDVSDDDDAPSPTFYRRRTSQEGSSSGRRESITGNSPDNYVDYQPIDRSPDPNRYDRF